MVHNKNSGMRNNVLAVDCQQIFPSARRVTFSKGALGIHEEGVGGGENQPVVPWPVVMEVELKSCMLSEVSVSDLGEVFCNCRHLTVKLTIVEEKGVPFQRIWEAWPSLESLELVQDDNIQFGIKWDDNLDQIFCGIHPEEAEYLRGQDDEFLQAFNIVSPFPALYHQKCTSKPVPSQPFFEL